MADTIRSTSEFLHASTGLFKDNTSGEISAQDLRDFVLSAYRPQMFAGGRLTLESGVPISSSDQNAKSILYYAIRELCEVTRKLQRRLVKHG